MTTSRSATVIGSASRRAMLSLTSSLSGNRSMARDRLCSEMRAPWFHISTPTVVSSPELTTAAATGSDTSVRPAIAICFRPGPARTTSIRSSSVSTSECARIGSATTSRSLAICTATSCGRCGAWRRLRASAARTLTLMSLAMIRTMSCALLISPSVSCGFSSD